MPNRHGSDMSAGEDYDYGFGGMMKDDEVNGSNNSYTTHFRQYDPRIGRWLSIDPLASSFPWQSPYVGFDNNPIYYNDPSGAAASDPPKDDGSASAADESGDYSYQCSSQCSDDDGWVKTSEMGATLRTYKQTWKTGVDTWGNAKVVETGYELTGYESIGGTEDLVLYDVTYDKRISPWVNHENQNQMFLGSYSNLAKMHIAVMNDIYAENNSPWFQGNANNWNQMLTIYAEGGPLMLSGVNGIKRSLIKNKLPVSETGKLLGEINKGVIKMKGATKAAGEFDFVVTAEGRTLLGRKHTYLSKGADVQAAGTLKIRNGQIVNITNLSGHYAPTLQQSSQYLNIMRSQGINVSKAHFKIYNGNGQVLKHFVP